jgi:hypothetical protein
LWSFDDVSLIFAEDQTTLINYHFMIVNGTGGASLCLWGVEIEFVSAMNSAVFILGGKVTLEDVKINNQSDTNWVFPLVLSYNIISSVTVNLHSCTITNSNYKDANYRLSPFEMIDGYIATQSLTLNMSFCSCLNNTFNLTSSGFGGVGDFYSSNESSSMWVSF